MCPVDLALLRNQILDFRDSEDKCEAILGELLHDETDHLEDFCFVLAVRLLLDGLHDSVERFQNEWKRCSSQT